MKENWTPQCQTQDSRGKTKLDLDWDNKNKILM